MKLIKPAGNALKYLTILMLVLVFHVSRSSAQEMKADTPRVSFGLGGSFIYGDIEGSKGQNGPGNVKLGYAYGGGAVFENMFSARFGAHTGIWYYRSIFLFEDQGSGDQKTTNIKAISNNIMIPAYLLIAFNSRRFSLCLLGGLQYLYIIDLKYSAESGTEKMEMDALKYMNYSQLGLAGGMEFKIRIKHIDLFFSFTAERYFTTFSKENSDSIDHIYGFAFRSGVLFRTFAP